MRATTFQMCLDIIHAFLFLHASSFSPSFSHILSTDNHAQYFMQLETDLQSGNKVNNMQLDVSGCWGESI